MSYVSETDTVRADGYSSAGREVVATYATYAEAQRAVDHLADASFPVEQTDIVGRDLRLVEHVTGRMTAPRAAAAAAGAGAWFGLFIGLLVGLFTAGPAWLGLLAGGLLLGGFWGAVFGFAAHWAGGGQRDFVSARALVAASYDVTVTVAVAERARQLLSHSR